MKQKKVIEYFRVTAVMNEKDHKGFVQKCKKLKMGKSTVVNMLIKEWLKKS